MYIPIIKNKCPHWNLKIVLTPPDKSQIVPVAEVKVYVGKKKHAVDLCNIAHVYFLNGVILITEILIKIN